jgi:hypothetical protein
METITACLLGDDRERAYPVTYLGVADLPGWGGDTSVALVRVGDDREALIGQHPEYGWCSVHTEFCRDFEPPIDQHRLEAAL